MIVPVVIFAASARLVAVVAVPVRFAVIVVALKLPDASRATIVDGVFASVAFEVTVNVEDPDWFAVNVAEPVSPIPETSRESCPLFGATVVTPVTSPFALTVIDGIAPASP